MTTIIPHKKLFCYSYFCLVDLQCYAFRNVVLWYVPSNFASEHLKSLMSVIQWPLDYILIDFQSTEKPSQTLFRLSKL